MNEILNPNGTASTAIQAPVIEEKSIFTPVEGKFPIAIGAIITGILYTLCFSGSYVQSGISSLLFFNSSSLILYLVLNKLKLIQNKKAFLLAIPIFLLSVCNAYFEYSQYNTYNCIAYFVLLSLMHLYAVRGSASKNSFLSLTVNNHCFSSTARVAQSLKTTQKETISKALLGAGISVPVIALIATLLASSDRAFSEAFAVFWDSLGFISFYSIIWKIIVFCAVATYFCGFYLYSASKKECTPITVPKTDATISVSFLTPVNLLFLFFCISQLSYVKNGMSLPEFTTYARYVHEAFFQLLAVTFINFTIILVFTEFLRNFSNKSVRFSLVALCVFTFVLILSSFYRMYLYITAYGFTTLRIEVLTFLSLETILVFITIASILKQKINILHHFVFFGIIGLLTLNITARPMFSANINKNIGTSNYENTEMIYYNHSCIPFLIEQYNSTNNQSKRDEISNRIRNLSNNTDISNTRKHWQSLSIQEEMNNAAATEFLKSH